MEFQILSWYSADEDKKKIVYKPQVSHDDEDDDDGNNALLADEEDGYESDDGASDIKDYVIYIFGKSLEGKTVCAKVKDFYPHFYLKVKSANLYHDYCEAIRRQLWKRKEDLIDLPMAKQSIKRVPAFGFTNGTKSIFLRFEFKTFESFISTVKFFKYKKDRLPVHLRKFELFDSELPPSIRLVHTQKFKMGGWIRVDGKSVRKCSQWETETTTDVELSCSYKDIEPIDRDVIAPFKELSFDIEAYSWDHKHFPDPKEPKDVTIQIGVTLKTYGSSAFEKKILLNLGPIDDIEDVDVRRFKKERDLLVEFANIISLEHNSDYIYAFNGDKFDWNFIFVRAKVTGCFDEFASRLSRFKDYKCRIVNATFSSEAYADNEYNRPMIPGRLSIDLLIHVLRGNEKYTRYNLNTIAESVLGDKKHDIHHTEIFKAYASADPARMKPIGAYCVQDTALVQNLVDKLDVVTQLTEMSNVTGVPIMYLLTKGQQIRVYSQLWRKAFENGFLIPWFNRERDTNQSYTGAKVIDPKTGAYFTPVQVLDFASLYPTIMMAYNICYSTLVLDRKFCDLPGAKPEAIKWEEEGENGPYELQHTFAQDCPSIIPDLLREMFQSRKRIKGLLKLEKDALKKRVLKGRELAIKVVMNSVYGFTSAFMMYCPEIAACVTAVGRRMINQTKDFMEKEFPAIALKEGLVDYDLALDVVGGDTDSVFVHYPKTSIAECIKLGKRAEVLLTETVFKRPPILMEYEKIYCPWICLKKKRYIGKMFEDDPNKVSKIDNKGVALTRRDYCPYVKDTYWKVVHIIMEKEKEGVQEAIETVRQNVDDLVAGKVPHEKLLLTRLLKKSYKNANLPHIKLAERMRQRDPGSAPQPGDRVPYLIIFDKTRPKLELYERAEDPEYIVKQKLTIDLLYYLNKQLKNPICDFMCRFVDTKTLDSIFEKGEIILTREQKGLQSITNFFGAKTGPSFAPKKPVGSSSAAKSIDSKQKPEPKATAQASKSAPKSKSKSITKTKAATKAVTSAETKPAVKPKSTSAKDEIIEVVIDVNAKKGKAKVKDVVEKDAVKKPKAKAAPKSKTKAAA